MFIKRLRKIRMENVAVTTSLFFLFLFCLTVPPILALDVPFFSQRDPNWGCQQLGSCVGEDIYHSGCATTSKAMVFSYYNPGYMNPGQLNSCLTNNGGYASGCLAPWDATNDICAPFGVTFAGHITSNINNTIDSELSAGYPVIAMVQSTSVPIHFVVITDKTGSTYSINDPWDLNFVPRTLDTCCCGPYEVKALWLYHYSLPSELSIMNKAAGPYTIKPGEILTLIYWIDNPTPDPIANIRLGAQIRKSDPQGVWIDDWDNDVVITAVPEVGNYGHYYFRYFRIPCSVDPGLYDVKWVILDDNTGEWLDSRESLGRIKIVSSSERKPADLNGDDLVNSADFGIMLSYWDSTSKPPADINQNGIVNSQDFSIMLSNWYSPWPFSSNICGLGDSYSTAAKFDVGEPRFSLVDQASLALSPNTGSYLIGESFDVDVFVNTAGQNVGAVAAYIKYDPAHFQVNSVDTTDSVFGMDAEEIIDSANGTIKISTGKSTPGVNVANGKIARVNLRGVSNIKPEADNFLLDFIPGSAFASSVIKDDALGTNILRGVSSARFAVRAATLKVGIDIKPGSYPNSINPKSKGKIPVAILSTNDFNALKMVDRNSLTFGRKGNEDSLAFCNPRGEDINGDRLKDLICHFYTEDTEFLCGDTEGVLKGKTKDGTPIQGSDSVRIIPCKK